MADNKKDDFILLGDHKLTDKQLHIIRSCMSTTLHVCKEEGNIDPELVREITFILLANIVKTELLYAVLDVQSSMRKSRNKPKTTTVH